MVPVEYLAGFVDGEGYLGLAKIPRRSRSTEYCLRVSLHNTNRRVLSQIQRSWGGVLVSVGQAKRAWKPAYALVWTNALAALLLHEIAPYLKVKFEQAAALLDFHRRVTRLPRARDSKGRLLPMSQEEVQLREAFYQNLRRMNMRGAAAHVWRTRRGSPVLGRMPPSAAYLAGFIDAEGALMITKSTPSDARSPQYRARLSVSNTKKAVLLELQGAYGGILVNQAARVTGWSDAYQLVWTDGRVHTVLLAVAPWLRIKREQAKILVSLVRHIRGTRQRRAGRFFARHPDAVIAFREALYRRARELNAKGVACGNGAYVPNLPTH